MMDKWTERLSEYIDGELTQAETEQLEAHLMECVDCGATLQQLRAVVARAGQVIDRPPQQDLWAGIAARIAEPAEPGDIVPMRRGRRFSFSVPQLAAASVALMLMSAGTMYLMVARDVVPQVAAVPAGEPAQQAAPQPGPAVRPVSDAQPVTTRDAIARPVPVVSPADDNYSVAIDELEGALANSRSRLDTATVRILETNLKAIDTAIDEAQAALARDPGNSYLNRYLDETMQRKIQLLRRATGIIRAQT